MGKLCMTLPPFSPDYSGVCSALFSLNCLTVIHDGAGCTGNYTGYDEPRWYHSNSPIYCSGLREIDAILGDDEKLIQKVLEAVSLLEKEGRRPELIALVGSPVPMVIGTDMEGIATELENRTGIRSFGFSATGLSYYPQGLEQVDRKLIRRILQERDGKEKRSEKILQTASKTAVNLLGASPLDFGKTATIEEMKNWLENRGYRINTCFWDCRSVAEIEQAVFADCNIVVSVAGLWLAEYMEQEYGIPYVMGLPYGSTYSEYWKKQLDEKKRTAKKLSLNQNEIQPKNSEILIIGEQLQSSAIRDALEYQYGRTADVAGICSWKPELAKAGDALMDSEADLEERLNREQYKLIIGDELYQGLLHSAKEWKVYNHYAVSSKLGIERSYSLIGEKLDTFFLCDEE